MVNEIKISIRAYANSLKVDEKAVREAIKGGKIKNGYDIKTKKITASLADKEWGFVHKNPKPQRGVSKAKVVEKIGSKAIEKKTKESLGSDKKEDNPEDFDTENFTYSDLIERIKIHPSLTYSESVRRKEILGIALDKMKLEELQSLLVRKEDVDKALFAIGVELKKKLMNIAARCISDIRAAQNDIDATNILNFELQLVLTNIPAEVQLQKN